MNQPILLETNRTKMVTLMLVLGPIAIAACYFGLAYADEWYGVTLLRTCIFILLCALGIVGAFGLVITLVKMWSLPKHALKIDQEGLHPLHGDFKNLHIYWKDIQGFQINKLGLTDVICVHVSNPQDLIQHYTGLRRKMAENTISRYGTPLFLMPMTYKNMTTDKLMQLLHNARPQMSA